MNRLRLFCAILALAVWSVTANRSCVAQANYRVAGIVTDSITGNPVPGAELFLSPTANLDQSIYTRSSSDGRFVFASVPAGKFSLAASHRGYVSQALDAHEFYMTAVAVGPGLDSEHIRFRLTPESAITGTILDESSEPVRGARIFLIQQSYFSGSHSTAVVGRVVTNDLGNYRLPHLAPGTYFIAVSATTWYGAAGEFPSLTVNEDASHEPSHISVPVSVALPNPLLNVVYPTPLYYPNSTTLAGASPLVLTPGSTASADFFLYPVPALHFAVKIPASLSAQDSANPDVDSSPSDSSSAYSLEVITHIAGEEIDHPYPVSSTSEDGTYEVYGVAPGELTVQAASEKSGNYRVQSQSINVSSDGVVDLRPASATVPISGVVIGADRVVAQGGEILGIPDAAITLSSFGKSYTAQVSSKGTFSFVEGLVEAGTYEAVLQSQTVLRIASVEAQGATVSGRRITISPGKPVKLTIHLLEENCLVTGIAKKGGTPFAGAMILLVPENPDAHAVDFRRDQSDSDGSFTLPPVLPGRYTLLALENGWNLEWSKLSVLFPYLPQGQIIDLKPGATFNAVPKVQ